jgi:alkylation response protein AidB-like acyl-CoA dehydrogenase
MYRAPLKDIHFILNHVIGAGVLSTADGDTEYSADIAEAVLSEAGRLCEEVLDPLNKVGDAKGVDWSPEGVKTAPGFKQAYNQYVEGGWPRLRGRVEHGGQPVPKVLATAVGELLASANLSFQLGPLLTQGAIEALYICGSPVLQEQFLPKMVSGEWTGTMNLTEPQAGSDLAQIRTRAVREGDHFRIFGQKIFITWGEHDLTPNIIHLVLARIEGAPPGVKGISLFVVPKVLLNADGSLGERNEVRCVSVEHKLGIHASPTCVMAYGDSKGAIGYLVGEENRGLEYMFIMMNAARLAVGVQGYAVAERAFQQALEWAHTRVQGKPPAAAPGATILYHPDVKRMLLTMKSSTEAMRALGLYAALQLDLAENSANADAKATSKACAELLIPIVKGWSTECGIEMASLGVQVHGGMGFIEETGAAQYLRDARITAIYEGTTGIQANDLYGRKLARDGGKAMLQLIATATHELDAIDSNDAVLQSLRQAVIESLASLRTTTQHLTSLGATPDRALAVAVPYLKQSGYVLGGWLMAKAYGVALTNAGAADKEFLAAKMQSARFFVENVLPNALMYSRVVVSGAASVLEANAELI